MKTDGSEKSVYKEVGMHGSVTSSVNRQRKKKASKERGLFKGNNEVSLRKNGHVFRPDAKSKSKIGAKSLCRNCGKPRFIVENEHCKGAR